MKTPSRRDFLRTSALTISFAGLQRFVGSHAGTAQASPSSSAVGYGPLLEDPNGVLRLPKGFSYKSFSHTGEKMDDGYYVPGAHDGMAAFPAPNGDTILVRNHEMSPGNANGSHYLGDEALLQRALRDGVYDAGTGPFTCIGGTTTLVYDTKTQTLKQQSLSLSGTIRNCSGGPTPWGSWITCEETVLDKKTGLAQDHGFCFEVPASTEMKLADPVPLLDMGRFNHEAIGVDAKTGIVYLTEDRPDGLFYRFIPNTPGKLVEGGRLQALAVAGSPSRDTRNWKSTEQPPFEIGQPVSVEWIDMEDVLAPQDDLRYRGFEEGAARFARGEGVCCDNDSIYFACTNGGAEKFGQIFRFIPGASDAESRLELFVESNDSQLLKSCDNLAIAPWGDVIIAEDDGGSSALVGVTPAGDLYHIAHVGIDSELAGACFSPDGSTLFVNIQKRPGQTLAITGPWELRG